jgi:hypothetical protein
MTIDTNALAEGIRNSAADSTIEAFVDLLEKLVGEPDPYGHVGAAEGSLIMDAYYYRRGEIEDDTEDEDEQDDLALADSHTEAGEVLAKLRDAIKRGRA